MNLSMADVGKAYVVDSIRGRDKVQRQLGNMGLIPGAQVRLLSSLHHNYIILLNQTRLGISRELLDKVQVHPQESTEEESEIQGGFFRENFT
ncbi:MAG: FeoA family protein [Firmicutes bacterium]|nr:FeoA family protein [Bacillota bacterium]